MAEENKTPRGCPQDCAKCSLVQHAYCAAQMALSSFPNFDAILGKLTELQEAVAELQAGRAELAQPEPRKAQKKGGGAENRPPVNETKED